MIRAQSVGPDGPPAATGYARPDADAEGDAMATNGTFTRMDDATPEELAVVVAEAQVHLNDRVADRLLAQLDTLKGPTLGYQVDRYEHSLQTATRAQRDGARTDMVVAALLHDIGDALAPANHSELAAAIVAPYVDAETTWVVRHHGVFQGYHYWHKIGFDRDATGAVPGQPLLRRRRPLLRRVGPAGLRPRLRHAADRGLRAARARGLLPSGQRLR